MHTGCLPLMKPSEASFLLPETQTLLTCKPPPPPTQVWCRPTSLHALPAHPGLSPSSKLGPSLPSPSRQHVVYWVPPVFLGLHSPPVGLVMIGPPHPLQVLRCLLNGQAPSDLRVWC